MSSNSQQQTESPTSDTRSSTPADDEQAVRAVFDAVSRAWADNDADLFTQWYTDEATAILPGYHLPSRIDIHASMEAAFAGPLEGSRRIHTVQKVRFLNADTAIVISRSGTRFQGEAEPAAERWALATWVLARHAGRWLIEAYHDCPAG
ncbi:SgcJ/EcaC family oxidoreductase [Actinacidiphila oryziradicis]|uniref:SgcJ/EcaC family oxidoreductase n=1 Tax=Actinacidiphila oryziradicis TaxID=2571141 RepID=UPI0023EFFB7D|nr:SgcJ/EcaC family oxidoreductase [Actinacidiphila oryziradicis]MCW2875440.1 hypothetical protein [Actinacidiphila oryziradicis]